MNNKSVILVNGTKVAWVNDGVVYIARRYWKRLKAYYTEYGYKHYVIV